VISPSFFFSMICMLEISSDRSYSRYLSRAGVSEGSVFCWSASVAARPK
jgi:hypothetical protein